MNILNIIPKLREIFPLRTFDTPKYPDNQRIQENVDFTRRDFLNFGVAAAAVAVISASGLLYSPEANANADMQSDLQAFERFKDDMARKLSDDVQKARYEAEKTFEKKRKALAKEKMSDVYRNHEFQKLEEEYYNDFSQRTAKLMSHSSDEVDAEYERLKKKHPTINAPKLNDSFLKKILKKHPYIKIITTGAGIQALVLHELTPDERAKLMEEVYKSVTMGLISDLQ